MYDVVILRKMALCLGGVLPPLVGTVCSGLGGDPPPKRLHILCIVLSICLRDALVAILVILGLVWFPAGVISLGLLESVTLCIVTMCLTIVSSL